MVSGGKTTQSADVAVRVLKESFAGAIMLAANDTGLLKLEIRRAEDAHADDYQHGSDTAAEIANDVVLELERYFSGELQAFRAPLDLASLSAFQRLVLAHTAHIPYGSVHTYGEVALAIGRPNSARAVGGALARNPIAIIIPCHRVVAHDGRLHGFSSPDGIRTKAKLLAHEGVLMQDECVQLNNQREA